jgi:hypothetical protein
MDSAESGEGADCPMIRGPRRVHCSYHKCLTVYFQRVFSRIDRSPFGRGGGYHHFDSRLDAFYGEVESYGVASVNNHAIDLARFEDVRVTRFIRDPRDLVVSGYFYHKRAAESWCDVAAPTAEDWEVVNGAIPFGLSGEQSFAAYLNAVSLEEGLIAELEFRRHHLASMRAWPADDPRIEVFRYEDIVGHEAAVFDRIFRFFELPFLSRQLGLFHARRFRAARRARGSDHIRDPRSGQWRDVFTPAVTRRFDDEYGDLIEMLDYPRR